LGDFADEEIAPSSPALIDEPWTFDKNQTDEIRNRFKKISEILGSISPHMTTNPEVIAVSVKNFIDNFMTSDWANFFFFFISMAYISIWTSGMILIVPPPLRTPGQFPYTKVLIYQNYNMRMRYDGAETKTGASHASYP
jgi:hypothetical protein